MSTRKEIVAHLLAEIIVGLQVPMSLEIQAKTSYLGTALEPLVGIRQPPALNLFGYLTVREVELKILEAFS